MSETAVAPLSSEGDQTQRDEFARWFYGQRAYPADRIPEGARANALAQAIRNNSPSPGGPGGPVSNVITPSWSALGPSTIPNGQTDTTVGPANPVSGRLTAIAVHPTDPNTVYAAGAQGGVWKTTNAMAASPVWTPLTDAQASNAVGAIAIDPVNPLIVYVGTGEPNGSCDSYYGQGILRSANGGASWTLLTGGGGTPFGNAGPFVGKSVARIIIDPMTAGSTSTTTLWAATTNGAFTSGTAAACLSPSGASRGVWKSTDSGATWTLQTAGSGTQSVKEAAIDPTNHDNLYAAVQASGVWKSTNAFTGAPAVYARQTVGLPDPTLASPALGRINLAIGGSAASNTLYASYSSSGSNLWGMFTTTNGGMTWAHLDNGFNGTCNVSGTTVTRLTGPSFVTGGAWNGRRIILNNGNTSMTVASVTNASTLVLTASGGSLAGVTWSVGTYPQYCNGQCFYDMTVAVDPTNANIVYIGGNPQTFGADLSGVAGAHTNWRSDDGGLTWTSISQGNASTGGVHTDDHVYAFDMTSGSSPRPVYDGNDGGIWRSGDKGASWTTMNTNIAITQFSGVATHPANMGIVLGGTQDNGTNLLNSALQPPPKWFHSDFGDGGQALIDQGTPARMFHTYFNQQSNFMGPAKSTTGGNNGPGNWTFVGSYFGAGGLYYNGINATDPVSFYAPIKTHPGYTPNVIYFGSNKLYRSADPGPPCCPTVSTTGCGFPSVVCTLPNSWTVVSPALTKGGSAFLSWIGVLPNLVAAKEVVYTGASDGRIEVTSNLDAGATATWTVIDKAPLPNRAVTEILVPGSDATGNTAYATFSGFNGNTPGVNGHVFKTTNGLGTATWTDISGDLPDIPVNAIASDPTTVPATLYVGTDIGVFQSVNSGTNWTLLSNGFPTVTVFGLERNPTTGQIVAATHGRGMFQLVAPPSAMNFFTLTPCRVADTRGAAGPYGGPSLAAGADRTFVVINQCGVPPTAKAISANFTVTGPTNGPGFLSFFPGGTPLPLVSTIDYSAGQTRANNAILPLGVLGDVTVHCGQGGGTADLVFDVNGYFQ